MCFPLVAFDHVASTFFGRALVLNVAQRTRCYPKLVRRRSAGADLKIFVGKRQTQFRFRLETLLASILLQVLGLLRMTIGFATLFARSMLLSHVPLDRGTYRAVLRTRVQSTALRTIPFVFTFLSGSAGADLDVAFLEGCRPRHFEELENGRNEPLSQIGCGADTCPRH